MIPFFRHDLGEEEKLALSRALDEPILTTGSIVREFEKKLAFFTHTCYALGINSATSGLFLTLRALGIGPGDEVITTPLTFAATAQAICHTGARPVFVDVEDSTGNLNAELIAPAVTPRTKAILPVHLYGWMCDMERIKQIADSHNLAVVEDAAHCLEGTRNGIGPGMLSDAAVFSFYATKSITCGEGGAIVTNREDVYEKCWRLSQHGRENAWGQEEISELGYKANMSNIQAAMLIPQLHQGRMAAKSIDRNHLFNAYCERLGKVLRVPENFVGHAHHLFAVRSIQREALRAWLMASDIQTGIHYRPLTTISYFRNRFPAPCPVAERIGVETLSLPFYPSLPDGHFESICAAIENFYDYDHPPRAA